MLFISATSTAPSGGRSIFVGDTSYTVKFFESYFNEDPMPHGAA